MADKPVNEVVAVDAVLDGLSSPTSSDVYEALQPFSNDAVGAVAAKRALAGGGGGGGFAAVGCVLEVYPLDVHDAGIHLCNWNALYDNILQFNGLGGIPAGLGLTFAFDGSDYTITTTEAGVWAFTTSVNFDATDSTWAGSLLTSNTISMIPSTNVSGATPGAYGCIVEKLPSGVSFWVTVQTTAQATDHDPYKMTVDLIVVRLA